MCSPRPKANEEPSAGIDGFRSISTWWTIGTAVLTSCLAIGSWWGGSSQRADRQEKDLAGLRSDISGLQSSTNDLKTYRDDTGKRLDKLSAKFDKVEAKIDKQRDDYVQVIRVLARVAAKLGVSDE